MRGVGPISSPFSFFPSSQCLLSLVLPASNTRNRDFMVRSLPVTPRKFGLMCIQLDNKLSEVAADASGSPQKRSKTFGKSTPTTPAEPRSTRLRERMERELAAKIAVQLPDTTNSKSTTRSKASGGVASGQVEDQLPVANVPHPAGNAGSLISMLLLTSYSDIRRSSGN